MLSQTHENKHNATIKERLSQIRALMAEQQLDYYFVPATDAHNNEYVPAFWQRRAWISGFTGSAGDVLIAKDNAYLWTDPRYFLQAENQLDSSLYQIMKKPQGTVPPIGLWLKEHGANQVCGVDPQLLTLAQAQKWEAALASVNGKLSPITHNLVDHIWHDQPPLALQPIRIHDIRYAGQSAQSKIQALRQHMQTLGAEVHIVTMLDAVAWLFNIRGNDINYNPLCISYALITHDHATLFAHMEHLDDTVKTELASQGITVAPYNSITEHLQQQTQTVLVDPTTTSWWTALNLKQANIITARSPISMMKSIKNSAEQQGAREAHRHDAIAVIRFLHFMETHWQEQTEISAADHLETLRREDERCVDLSFTTISGYGDHGAIIHYSVDETSNRPIGDQSLYLIDSGGQYYEGTTDITRTVHFGEPTTQQKHYYTLVLKGHLALRHAVFPEGLCGEDIDAIAHLPLWAEGLNYGHGTGHGVGCYLCVHEGPQRISAARTGVPLRPGMIVSNEPGLYLTGEYGIRIENLCLIQVAIEREHSITGHGPFLTLDDLTLVPYARKLIHLPDLTPQEIQWIDDYHHHIYQQLHAKLPENARAWLQAATRPLKAPLGVQTAREKQRKM